jgi:hypothetical protein
MSTFFGPTISAPETDGKNWRKLAAFGILLSVGIICWVPLIVKGGIHLVVPARDPGAFTRMRSPHELTNSARRTSAFLQPIGKQEER